MLSENFFMNETKNHNPPFKLNGRSLTPRVFPPKQLWKSIVYSAVNETHSNEWSLRMSSDNDFLRFRNIHRSVELANIWKYSKSSRDIKKKKFNVKLMTDIPKNTESICVVCNRHFSDIIVHACCSCSGTQFLQEAWWDIPDD